MQLLANAILVKMDTNYQKAYAKELLHYKIILKITIVKLFRKIYAHNVTMGII